MKQYPALAVITFLLLNFAPACKKAENYPFWSNAKKFEFQHCSFVYTEREIVSIPSC
jgi:hypothetical protein